MKCFLFLLFCVSAYAAEPLKIDNRKPQVGEIGYIPVDGSTVLMNPPSLAWLHEAAAVAYEVQVATNTYFQNAISARNLSFNTYTHNRPLKPNEYFWRYRYLTKDKARSGWSQTRKFVVPKEAILFPMPSAEERRKVIPAGHPRIFVRPEDLPGLRQAASGSARFAALLREADVLISQPVPTEPVVMGSTRDRKNLEAIAHWRPNRIETLNACVAAETVAFVYLITGDEKYGVAARSRILALANWNPDGPTSFKVNCEAAKPLLHRLSRAYDWAYDALTPEDRKLVRAAILRRINDAWESGEVQRGVGHLNRPLNSHGNRTWHKIGESGIVFLGEIAEADKWLDYALNKYYACYPVWSDSDGGWHEGNAYLGGYMAKTVWWLQAAQTSLKLDPLQKQFFSQMGDFPLYLAPPHSPNAGFGDLSYSSNFQGWGVFMEYFIRVASARKINNAAAWRWWGEEWKTAEPLGVLGFLYEATLPPLPAAHPPTNLPPSKIFHGVGLASLHTTLLNSSNDVHVLFKSSPFGSQSHGHNPQNTFQLNAYGDALLTPCVYRDLHGSPFHEKWAHQTVSQNGVLVNGKGQKAHHALSRGKIIASHLTPQWDYVLGDAKEAYEGRLERALRHVVFVKPEMVVVFDDLVAGKESDFQFMLHGLSPFKMDEAKSALHIQRSNAGALVQYLGSVPVKFRQWDGFDPKPTRDFDNQWHVEASTRTKEKAVQMFTLIIPYQGSAKPEFTVERLQSSSAHGLKIKRGGEITLIGIRHAGLEQAELSGVRFAAPVLVQVAESTESK